MRGFIGEWEYERITLWTTRYAIRLVMHMNAMEVILSRKIVFFVDPVIDDDRSDTREIERISDAMEIPSNVSAFRLIDLICVAITSISSLEMDTTSSLEASLRKESYFFSNDEMRFLLTSHTRLPHPCKQSMTVQSILMFCSFRLYLTNEEDETVRNCKPTAMEWDMGRSHRISHPTRNTVI